MYWCVCERGGEQCNLQGHSVEIWTQVVCDPTLQYISHYITVVSNEVYCISLRKLIVSCTSNIGWQHTSQSPRPGTALATGKPCNRLFPRTPDGPLQVQDAGVDHRSDPSWLFLCSYILKQQKLWRGRPWSWGSVSIHTSRCSGESRKPIGRKGS